MRKCRIGKKFDLERRGYVWRDPNDFDGEFFSFIKPKQVSDKSYAVNGGFVVCIPGRPFKLARGEVLMVSVSARVRVLLEGVKPVKMRCT